MKKLVAQKQTFQKWAGAHKNRIDKNRIVTTVHLYIKMLGMHFVNSALDNNNWDIINDK